MAYMWTLIIQMNLFTNQKQTHRHRKQPYGYQRGKRVINQENGIHKYTRLHVKINNKDFLFSIGYYIQYSNFPQGFPCSSVGKESACNAEDRSLIPGSGRSAGERIGYTLQYSWASFVAQLVKNSPAMWETWVRPWVGKVPLENGKATHSSILA